MRCIKLQESKNNFLETIKNDSGEKLKISGVQDIETSIEQFLQMFGNDDKLSVFIDKIMKNNSLRRFFSQHRTFFTYPSLDKRAIVCTATTNEENSKIFEELKSQFDRRTRNLSENYEKIISESGLTLLATIFKIFYGPLQKLKKKSKPT